MTKWRVLEGWGDKDSPDDCWGVDYLPGVYDTREEADAAAEQRYESQIQKHMQNQPADWKSYWVTAMEEGA